MGEYQWSENEGVFIPPRPLPLRVNFSWTFAGNVVYSACQWAVLAVMAKLGSAQGVGEFALGLALTAPVYMLTNLQLRGIQATDARGQHEFGHYLGLRLIGIAVSLIIVSLLVLARGFQGAIAWTILLVGLAKASESASDIFYGLLQKHEQMNLIAISLILRGLLSLTAGGMAIWATGSTLMGIAALALSWMLVLTLYDLPNARRLEVVKPHFQTRVLWPLFWTSLPLGTVMMMISLNTNLPRYYIEYHLGTEALGYFSAISYIMVAGTTVVSALGQSASPRLSRCSAAGDLGGYRGLVIRLLLTGLAVGFVGIGAAALWGREILTAVYREEYAVYNHLFLLLMLGAGISYLSSFLGYSMTAARCFKVQPLIFMAVAVTMLLSCRILVPVYGLKGAAYAVIIAASVELLGSSAAVIAVPRKLKTVRIESEAQDGQPAG